jgi:hypothetical protein
MHSMCDVVMVRWYYYAFSALITIFFVIFSACVMTYVSLAVPIGPWIDPTLALLAFIMMQILSWLRHKQVNEHPFLVAIAGGGIGGVIGTAAAWSFPTLYFLDTARAQLWLAHPVQCVGAISAVIVIAGGFGLVIARLLGTGMSIDRAISFPVAQLVVKTIESRDHITHIISLIGGVISATLFHMVQQWTVYIPHIWRVMRETWFGMWRFPALTISLDVAPMLWALGFTTGHVLAVPFAVGVGLKGLILEPCYRIWFLSCMKEHAFMMAFCTGLVLQSVAYGFWHLLSKLVRARVQGFQEHLIAAGEWVKRLYSFDVVMIMAISGIFLVRWCEFSVLSWIYLIVTTALSVFQLMLLMGRTGLAPFPRFATFVMIPGLVIFGYTPFQAMLVTAFVEIAGGVAAVAASGYKMGVLGHVKSERWIYYTQWLALLVCSVCVALVLYMLTSRIGLGSALLNAQRCQTRALQIQAHDMNVWVVGLGILAGMALERLRINGTLVLGGLLMPLDWSLLLISGGLSTYAVKKKEDQYPFWSGIFVVSSLWIVIRAFLTS